MEFPCYRLLGISFPSNHRFIDLVDRSVFCFPLIRSLNLTKLLHGDWFDRKTNLEEHAQKMYLRGDVGLKACFISVCLTDERDFKLFASILFRSV